MSKSKKTLPAFLNQFPWNELLFRGEVSAKTRSWTWGHIGWTLLYTSKSRVVRPVMDAYGLEVDDTLGCLVGVGWLKSVRRNTTKERAQLESQYSNGGGYIGIIAGLYRFEFAPLHRFTKPIPFVAPRGAARIFTVPYPVVAKELELLGISI